MKIEADPKQGRAELVQGAWRYMRGGQEVIGVFWGELRGNVLTFKWHEPAQPRALEGSGYLVFETDGTRFNGKWWTTTRDRSGDWNGWRADGAGMSQPTAPQPGGEWSSEGGAPYGGSTYGGNIYGSPYDETAPGPPPPPPDDYSRGGPVY